ncbi:NACHT domain-containing protein [Streptomyces sp. 2-1]|uniref:NACHT domain-containing protein n=1 Tax=Streptomyces sp. 2-1 TaxID=412710 RepID=UPI003AFA58A5
MSVGTAAASLWISYSFALGVPGTLLMLLPTLPPAYLTWQDFRFSRMEADQTTLNALLDSLADEVRIRWEAEATLRRLNDPQPLPVSWESAPTDLTESWDYLRDTAMAYPGGPPSDPAAWAAGPNDLAGSDNEIAAVLAKVPTGRLIVVGEPGAGKTMLLLRLTLDLLHRRLPGEPVPVLLPLATWNPDGLALHDWLTTQLVLQHPMLGKPAPSPLRDLDCAEALVSRRHLLLILDGLDELPSDHRALAVRTINEALRPGERVVVSSRTAEFRRIAGDGQECLGIGTEPPVKLRNAAAVVLRPLDQTAVARYLRRDAASPARADRWDPVLHRLGTAEPVALALSTPLNISLARTVYAPDRSDRDPAELCDTARFPTSAVIGEHLFDAFIPSAYRTPSSVATRQDDCGWTVERAEKAFLFLARALHSGSISAIRPMADLRDRLVPDVWRRITYAVASVALVVLLALLVQEYSGSLPDWCWYTVAAWTVYRLARIQSYKLLYWPSSMLAGLIGQWRYAGAACAVVAFWPLRLPPLWIAGWCAGWLVSLVMADRRDFCRLYTWAFHHTWAILRPYSWSELLAAAGTVAAVQAADRYAHLPIAPCLVGLAAWQSYRLVAGAALYLRPMLSRRPPPPRVRMGFGRSLRDTWAPWWARNNTFRRWHKILYRVTDWLAEPIVAVIALVVTLWPEPARQWSAYGLREWAVVGCAALTAVTIVRKFLARLAIRLTPVVVVLILVIALWQWLGTDWARFEPWEWTAVALTALAAEGLVRQMTARAASSLGTLLLLTSFLPVRAFLALTGDVPWRLVRFLAHAHETHGVLRRSGAVYEFRHVELHRRLAERWYEEHWSNRLAARIEERLPISREGQGSGAGTR